MRLILLILTKVMQGVMDVTCSRANVFSERKEEWMDRLLADSGEVLSDWTVCVGCAVGPIF